MWAVAKRRQTPEITTGVLIDFPNKQAIGSMATMLEVTLGVSHKVGSSLLLQ
jgi:hypothetical protein